MKKGKISFLAGLLGGTLLGVLFAPHKGKELRDKIKKEREKGQSGLNTIKDEFCKMGGEISDSFSEVCESDKVQALGAAAQQKAEELKEKAATKAKEVQKKAKSVAKKATNQVKKEMKKMTSKEKRNL